MIERWVGADHRFRHLPTLWRQDHGDDRTDSQAFLPSRSPSGDRRHRAGSHTRRLYGRCRRVDRLVNAHRRAGNTHVSCHREILAAQVRLTAAEGQRLRVTPTPLPRGAVPPGASFFSVPSAWYLGCLAHPSGRTITVRWNSSRRESKMDLQTSTRKRSAFRWLTSTRRRRVGLAVVLVGVV